ncbi:carcinine transporter-like [Aricia agestis]|uniref:carcinine transporter-like n=1 Tax=Aricia agestis TaxID=91739 RepID=UPI001C20BC85|nr:carcinine transporter-like [Aricia agestis]
MDSKEEKTGHGKEKDEDILDSILGYIGEFGRYQKLMFLGMAPFGFFFAFVYFVQMFVTPTPQKHWCKVPELSHLDMELRRNLTMPVGVDDGRCLMYDANWTEVLATLNIPPDTPVVPCKNGWEFELVDIPYDTVVSEREWVCDNAGYIPSAQAAFFSGSLVGGVFFGWTADRFGRVPALVGANMIALVGGIATIYTTDFWDFAFTRFLVGMAYDSCFMTIYILALEYVGAKYRTWVANMSIAIYFGSGCILLPWLALWLGSWRRLIWATSLPMLVVLAVPFTAPESARWLTSRGRVNQAVKVLRRFEKINGTKVPDEVMDEFVIKSNQTRNTSESIVDLMRSGPLRNMAILLVFIYMACALIFDGLVRMSEGLGLDFFITFTLTSATEIPSVTLLAFVLDKWGRRMLTCVPMTISGVLILIAIFVPKGVPQVTLAIMARFLINMSYNTVLQWSTELLPTPVRASGSSLIHVSGYVATVISPFIVYSERLWSPLPLLILGVCAVVGGSVGIFVPETNGKPMPQTIDEGERFVRSFTVCGKAEDVEEQAMDEKQKALVT